MSAIPQTTRLLTPLEYLSLENAAEHKYEYRAGRIRMMAGGSLNHSKIFGNLYVALHNRLRGKPCQPFDSNLRVRVPQRRLFTYPDISVICGQVELDPTDKSNGTVLNPTLLVEVLSPSTERYDRGRKFDHYDFIDSLQQYVLVAQEWPSVQVLTRGAGKTWIIETFSGLEAVAKFRSIDVEVPLAEIYAGVDFPDPDAPPEQPEYEM